MNKEQFKKGIEDVQELELTHAEKKVMLKNIFATPIVSPYAKYMRVAVTISLVAVLMFGTVASAAERAVPGEKLYVVKTGIVEPIIDKLNTAPGRRVVWEEKKVGRRIAEAEKLADKNELDEKKTEELEKKIEKSGEAFALAVERVASTTATTTEGKRRKSEELKKEFRVKLEESRDHDSEDKEKRQIQEERKNHQEEKIERLKERAKKSIEKRENSGRGKDRD